MRQDKRYFSLGWLCVFLLAFSSFSKAANLHAVLLASDLDDSIGPSVAVDLAKAKKLVKGVADAADLDLKLHVFNQSKFNKDYILKSLNAINVNRDDAVFFYYTGHGARYRKTPTHWPDMLLARQFTSPSQLYSFYDATDLLVKKSPRFMFAVIDACNSYLDRSPAEASSARALGNPDLYRRLFTQYQGVVRVSATSPGETALGNINGGAFSRKLFSTMSSLPASADWQKVSQSVSAPIVSEFKGSEHRQTPLWQVSVSAYAPPKPQPAPPKPQPAPPNPPTTQAAPAAEPAQKECSMDDYLRAVPGCE